MRTEEEEEDKEDKCVKEEVKTERDTMNISARR